MIASVSRLWRVPSWSHRANPSAARLGAVGAVVAFIGIALMFAFEQPPFAPPDETAHLGYAHEIADLDLPEVTEPADVPSRAVQWQAELASRRDDRYRDVWVANHPPLFYVLTAPLIWLSNVMDRADGGLMFLRLANVTFAAVGVGLTYLLGRDLSGGVRRIGVAAAAIAAFVPQGHALFSEAMNDGLGFAAATAVVWAAVRCIGGRSGNWGARDLALLSVAAAVCAGARSTTLLVAVVTVAWVAVTRFHRTSGSTPRRLSAAAVVAAVGLLPAAVLFGWFYVRNWSLYGDFAGSRFLLDRFGRSSRGSLLDVLSWGHLWVDLYHKLMSPSPTFTVHAPPGVNPALLLAVAGVVVVAVIGRTGDVADPAARSPFRRSALALCVAIVVVVIVTVAQHVSGGGSRYARYLLPALGVAAALAAIGFDRLLRRALPAVAVVLMAFWALRNVPSGIDPSRERRRRDGGAAMPDVLQVLPASPWLRSAAVVLVIAGCTALAVSLAAAVTARPGSAPATKHGSQEE